MTLTIDTRFDDNMDKYLEAWIKTPDDDNQLLVMTTRYVMETYDDYGKAFDYLKGMKMHRLYWLIHAFYYFNI